MKTKNRKLKMGMIGLGTWAQDSYLPYFLSKESGVEVKSLSQCFPNILGYEIAKKFGIDRYYPSYQAMIKKENLDAVTISTPHTYHFKQAKFALENGCHVLLDKPLALKVNEAEILTKTAEKSNLILSVYTQRRYWKEYLYAKKIIQDGGLGQIIAISGLFSQMVYPDYARGWRSRKNLSGGGILIDSGYHLLDTILWITNLIPDNVYATASYDRYAVDAQVSLSITFDNNVPASCLIIRGTPKDAAQEEITIYGTMGIIKIARNKLLGKRNLYLLHLGNDGIPIKEINQTNVSSDLISPAKSFLNIIRKNTATFPNGSDAISTIKILECAYKSLQLNKVIKII